MQQMHQQKKHKEDIKNSVGRLLFVGIAIILQLLWFALVVLRINQHYLIVSILTRIVTVGAVLGIFGRHTNATVKLSWIFLILAVPILGLLLYLLSTRSNFVKTMQKRFAAIDDTLFRELPANDAVLSRLRELDPGIANQAYFLKHSAGFPTYQNTDVTFYGDAWEGLEAQKEELRRAKKFIFMEYHAIEDAEAFGGIKEILAGKAREGVEVRVFYDDIGSVGFLNASFIREMEELGIACRVFNPIVPIVNLFMNNRDHRKITVIDGRVGFTGGYNLANEYFNLCHPYGHWKDSGIRLEGEAVQTLTVLFLEMWNAMERANAESAADMNIRKYLPDIHYQAHEDGFVIPFGDSPMDETHTGEDVYLNLIQNAKRYVYIMTPYLIITDDMIRELTLAARRGVDVRIITPGIPDKKMIYHTTRSYYNALVRHGVRIYEYTPGFCHAKQVAADDELAVIGTINFDYRSLYHHFEDAVVLYKYDCIKAIRADFEESFRVSEEVTEKYNTGRSTALRIGHCILRLCAPML